MTAWASLQDELDRWAAAGRRAELWWRDDDAAAETPALERLLDLAARSGQPLALAVIPAAAEAGLEQRIAALADKGKVSVLQHGFAHLNHAPDSAKKCELVGPERRPAIFDELRQGHAMLRAIFGRRLLSVLVPPWNRIDPAVAAGLAGLGFTGLSTYKPRRQAEAQPGLQQVNCHLDILQWRPERRFLGEEAALSLLCGHLRSKREGQADPDEPTGILSHHGAHDEAAWRFLETLLETLDHHPAARLLSAEQCFPGVTAGSGAGILAGGTA